MKNKAIDMTTGPILRKIIAFIIPLLFTNLLQQLYHMADMMVVGRFVGSTALAAVGATGSLTNLLVNFVVSLSVGASTLLAQHQGAGDKMGVARGVRTSMAIALIFGILFSVLGMIFCRPMLELMNTPENVIDESVLYIRIIFAGFPVSAIYNFGAAILRAKGDTKRPMFFLGISGAVNVILNVVFVVIFGMGVEGVAIPTVISQLLSAAMVVICLVKEEDHFRLDISKIRLYKNELKRIFAVGLPIAFSEVIFSVSNIMIQASLNTLGEVAMAGVSAANNINSILYTAIMVPSHAAIIFCGQNYGAGKYKRIARVMLECCAVCTVIGIIVGSLFILFSKNLLSLFTTEKKVIEFGVQSITVLSSTYFLCGIAETMSGTLKAINKTVASMINSIVCLVGIRILWVLTYFPLHRSIPALYVSYPISWIGTIILHLIVFMVAYNKLKKPALKVPERV